MPIGEGVTTGVAQARLTIDYSDLNAVEGRSQQAGQTVERNLNRINNASNSAALGFKQLAGAIGVSLGAAQALNFVISSDRIATSYRRQQVAAVYLAGSQERVNELLEAYDRVTGGAVDKATALAQVTRLIAVGFADSTEEMEQMVRISRGASLAMGTTAEYVLGQLQLALANQTTARLDQIGIGIEEFQASLAKVKREQPSLSKEMAFQIALLTALDEKFGELADSPEAAATGAEKATRAFKDLRLAWGEFTGPAVGFLASGVAEYLETLVEHATLLRNVVVDLGQAFGLIDRGIPSSWNEFGRAGQPSETLKSKTGIGTHIRESPERQYTDAQKDLFLEMAEAKTDIDESAEKARTEAVRQYGEQRTALTRQYEKQIAREAADFARERLRAEQDFQRSILKLRADAARMEAFQQAELTRRISQVRADTTERIAEWEQDYAETVTELREDSNKKLADLEENYQLQRRRAAEQHAETLLGAASRLDAAAVFAEQRRYAVQQRQAAEDHQKRIEDEKESLDERIQQEQESHAERIEKEREQLDKRIRMEQDNYDRQARLRRDDMERTIEEMKADFELRKAQEDEDRRIRLERLAQDHQDQLTEMANQHILRLGQIRDQAKEERELMEEKFKERLIDVGLFVDAWIDEQERLTKESARLVEEYLKGERLKAAGLKGVDAIIGGSHPSEAEGPYFNRSPQVRASSQTQPMVRASTVTVEEGAITVQESQRPGETAQEVENHLVQFFRRMVE